jgi:aryl-alcohol dehydrogenase
MAAKAVGCTTIIGVDINEERLQLALELGCTSIVNSKGVDRESLIAQLHSKLPAGSAAGLDFSLDTTGRPDILRTAFEALRSTGVCALVGGSAPGSTCEIPMDKILLGRTLRGVIQGDAVSRVFLPQLLMLHVQGKFPFDRLITYYEGLEHVNQAAQDSLSGKTIKPVLVLSQP